MIRLFLTSSFIDVSDFLQSFTKEELKGKTITFIPTASVPEVYKDYVENDKIAFETLGLIIEQLDISNLPKNVIKETIERNDLIYISGGNTFYLLQELRNSGADTIIIEEIKKGKPYIGASAGSIIMSPNISYIEKMDAIAKAKDLNDLNALNIVDFYPLPHHTNEPFKKIVEEIIQDYEGKIKLIPISNTEAIEIVGNNMNVVGRK